MSSKQLNGTQIRQKRRKMLKPKQFIDVNVMRGKQKYRNHNTSSFKQKCFVKHLNSALQSLTAFYNNRLISVFTYFLSRARLYLTSSINFGDNYGKESIFRQHNKVTKEMGHFLQQSVSDLFQIYILQVFLLTITIFYLHKSGSSRIKIKTNTSHEILLLILCCFQRTLRC